MKWQVAEEQNEVKAQGCKMRNSIRRKSLSGYNEVVGSKRDAQHTG